MRHLSIAIAALALLGVLWWLSRGEIEAPRVAPMATGQIDPSTQPGDLETAVPAASAAMDPAETTRVDITDPDTTTETCALIVRVRYSDGTPVRGVTVMLQRPSGDPRIGIVRSIADDDGTSRFSALQSGQWHVRVTATSPTRTATVEVRPDQTTHIELVVPVSLHIEGRVVNPEKWPVPGAQIVLAPPSTPDHDAGVVAVSDQQGHFVVRSGLDPSILGARASGFGPSRMVMITSERGVDRTGIELVLQPAGGDVRGRVTSPEARGIAGATIRIGEGRLDAIRTTPDGASPVAAQTWSNDDGEFSLVGLTAGDQPVSVRAPGWAPWSGQCTVEPGKVADCLIVLNRGGAIAGRVATATGEPIGACEVTIGQRGMLDFSQCRTDGDGRFGFDGVSPGSITVTAVDKHHGKREVQVDVLMGASSRCDIILDAGRVLTGRVIDQHGQPVRRVAVRVTEVDGGKGISMKTLDAHGRFRVVNLPDGQFNVDFTGPGIVHKQFRRVDPSGEEIPFIVETRQTATAYVFGLVVGPTGLPVGGAKVSLFIDEALGRSRHATSAHTDIRTGLFRIGPVPPGVYDVRVEASGFARQVLRGVGVDPSDARDLQTIVMRAGGHVRLTSTGERPEHARVEVWNSQRQWVCDIPHDVSTPLEPGRYTIRVWGRDIAEDSHVVDVVEGQEHVVAVQWSAGRPFRLVMDHTAHAEDQWVEVTFISASGRALARRLVLRGGDTRLTDERWLSPGDYEVSVQRGGKQWRGKVTIEATGDGPQILPFQCGG